MWEYGLEGEHGDSGEWFEGVVTSKHSCKGERANEGGARGLSF